MGSWGEAVAFVMKRASQGDFKLSELTGIRKRVAETLIDRGKLHASPLPNGDYIVGKM